MKKGQLVRVEWKDIQDQETDDWNDPDVLSSSSYQTQVGYLAQDFTRKSVDLYLASVWCPEEERHAGARPIPAGTLVNIQRVEFTVLEEWENVGVRWHNIPIGDEEDGEESTDT